MITRTLWLNKIKDCWKKRSLVWLSGVRRVGKTTLAKEFKDALYLNCDLPSVREMLQDPEFFYKNCSHPIIIFDEIHQLEDPSQILKIGADEFSRIKILATGSSTLAATRKFKDSLAGRKFNVSMLPVLVTECHDFGVTDIRKRLLYGGLPNALLSAQKDPALYSEWLDSFYARDVHELFRVDKRHGFLQLCELLLRQSGALLEVTSLAKHAGLSRPTVMNYLEILQATLVLRLVRPFHGGGRQEIISQPKAYGFDTGFISYYKGFTELREDDCGILWEHLVLDYLISTCQPDKLYYWRDKQKREIDFIYAADSKNVHAIECKWNPAAFDVKAIKAFREIYPGGKNVVVSPKVMTPYKKKIGEIEVIFTGITAESTNIF